MISLGFQLTPNVMFFYQPEIKVSYWFYKGSIAELPVPKGGRQQWDISSECRALREKLVFLRFYKVSGPPVLVRGFLARSFGLDSFILPTF